MKLSKVERAARTAVNRAVRAVKDALYHAGRDGAPVARAAYKRARFAMDTARYEGSLASIADGRDDHEMAAKHLYDARAAARVAEKAAREAKEAADERRATLVRKTSPEPNGGAA